MAAGTTQATTLAALENRAADTENLLAFTNGVIAVVDQVYQPRLIQALPYQRRDEFTVGYNRFRAGLSNTLDGYSVRESMN